MSSRRQSVLDAAIRVLGNDGPRGLTHRATDLEADLPLGSTANLFGRRGALLDGVVERLLERDHDLWRELWDGHSVSDSAGVARALVGFVNAAAEPGAAVALRARYYLQLDRPDAVRPGNLALTAELETLLSSVGAPPDCAEPVLALVDGLLLRTVTYGRELLPDDSVLTASLTLMIAGS